MTTKRSEQIISLINAGNYAKAEKLCLKRLKKKSKDCETLNILGGLYLTINNINNAFRILKKARKICKNHIHIQNNLGEAYRRAGKPEQAFAEFNASLAIAPNQSTPQNNIGAIYYQRKEYSNAAKYFKKAIMLRPDFAQAIDNLALTYRGMGKLDDAAQLHIKANNVDDSLRCVYLNLVKTLMFLHSTDDVCNVALSALEEKTFNREEICDLHITLATVFWLTDQQEQLEFIFSSCPAPDKLDDTYHNIKNITAYYSLLHSLLTHKSAHPHHYQGNPTAPLFFIGDSHALSPANVVVKLNNVEYRVLASIITGCKAYHLGRNIKDEYKESLKKLLAAYPPSSKIIFGFGEIDCRRDEGFFHLHKTKQKDYRATVPKTVERYFNFVLQNALQYKHYIYFYGVPAPLESLLSTLSHADRAISINIIALFNSSLKLLCQKNSIPFLDTYALTANQEGYSNNKYHLDDYHLKPLIINDLFKSHHRSFKNFPKENLFP